MTNVTTRKPAAGIYWNAAVYTDLSIAVAPNLVTTTFASKAMSLFVEPSISFQPPSHVTLRVAPSLSVAAQPSVEGGGFNLMVSPRIGTVPSTAYLIHVTPGIGMTAYGTTRVHGRQRNQAVRRASLY